MSCLLVPALSISRLLKATWPLPALVPASKLVLPSSGPLPELKLSVTGRLPPRPIVESFPNWSWVLTAGCAPKGAPAVAEPGWAENARRLAEAGLTAMVPEVALVSVPLVN